MNYGIQGMRPNGRINFDLTSRFTVTIGKIRVPSFYFDGNNVNFRENVASSVQVYKQADGVMVYENVQAILPKSRRYQKQWVIVYNPIYFQGWDSVNNMGQYITPSFDYSAGDWRIPTAYFNERPGHYGGFDIYIGCK